MLNRNLDQIFQSNPATNFEATDLIYLVRYPYGSDNDMAGQFSTLQSQLVAGNFPWQVVTNASQNLNTNNGYIANRPSLIMMTMPPLANVGDVIKIVNLNIGGFQLALNTGVQIAVGNKTTQAGPTGYVSSTSTGDAIELVCVIANSFWFVTSMIGNLQFI